MKITPEIIKKHGINSEEYKKIINLLGRNPNLLELGLFSAMWNEHCSYKSSKKYLRTLPTKNSKVIQVPGENAERFNRITAINSTGTQITLAAVPTILLSFDPIRISCPKIKFINLNPKKVA